MFCTTQRLATTSVIQDWVQDASREGQTDNYLGKRAHARTTWTASLAIRILTGPDKGKVVMVKARDISSGGLGFISRLKIEPHTQIEICAGNNARSVVGRVMHQTRAINGFIVGVAFDVPSPVPSNRLAG